MGVGGGNYHGECWIIQEEESCILDELVVIVNWSFDYANLWLFWRVFGVGFGFVGF